MPKQQVNVGPAAEADLVAGARQGREAAVRAIIRHNNRRLFRVARAIVRDDSEAEDVVQESYVRAFTRLGDFRGESSLSTWLTASSSTRPTAACAAGGPRSTGRPSKPCQQ